jgi:hypothetical protein
LQALWHYAPTCAVQIEEKSIVSDNPGEGNLRIVPVGEASWEVEVVQGQEEPFIQGWYSAEYGKKVPNPTAVYTCAIENPTTFAWILMPSKGKVPPVKSTFVIQDEQSVVIEVNREGEKTMTVTVPMKGGTPVVN